MTVSLQPALPTPLSFSGTFAERFAATAGPLAAGSHVQTRNRPILQILSRWIDEMWLALDEYGPVSKPLGRYPFEGPSPWEWELFHGVPPNVEVPTPITGSNSSGISQGEFKSSLLAGALPWLHVGSRFFVLLRLPPMVSQPSIGPETPSTALAVERLRLSPLAVPPIEAATLGLLYRVFEAGADHFAPWWYSYISDGLTFPDAPPFLPVVISQQDIAEPITALWNDYVTGRATRPQIAVFTDPGRSDGAASVGDTRFVSMRPGLMTGAARLETLRERATEFWSRSRAGVLDPEPPGFADALNGAANFLVARSNLLAHEILHLVWSVEGGRFAEGVEQRGWGRWSDGPLMIPQAVGQYVFPPWSRVPVEEDLTPSPDPNEGMEGWTAQHSTNVSSPLSGSVQASRHWAHFLFGTWVKSLLMNGPAVIAFAQQHQSWCDNHRYPYFGRWCDHFESS